MRAKLMRGKGEGERERDTRERKREREGERERDVPYSSGSVLPFGKNLSVENPLTPNLLPRSLSLSASTLAMRTESTLSKAFPTSS